MAEENGTTPLVKRFVEDCKECFQNVKAHIFQHSNLSKEDAHEVVETLFFRLLFLRFLEEKEWLTSQEIQTISMHFMIQEDSIPSLSIHRVLVLSFSRDSRWKEIKKMEHMGRYHF